MTDCRFANVDKTAGFGGSCIYNVPNTETPDYIRLNGCRFDSCDVTSATADGGAIYLRDVTDFIVRSCIFTRCTAPDESGAIVVYNLSAMDSQCVYNSLFVENEAGDGKGGALRILAINPQVTELDHCTFHANVDTTNSQVYVEGLSTNIHVYHTIVSGGSPNTAAFRKQTQIDEVAYCNTWDNSVDWFDGHMGDASPVDTIHVDPKYNSVDITSNTAFTARSSDKDGTASSCVSTADGSYMGWRQGKISVDRPSGIAHGHWWRH